MKLTEDLSFIAQKHKNFYWALVLIVIPVLYFLSGFYSVGQEQRAVVTRLGKIIEDNVMPGMHYHLPWPFESVQKISSTSLRSISVNFGEDTEKFMQPELTTGDGNMVDVELEVQFNISEPGFFYNATLDSENMLRQTAISETLYYVGANNFESLLTTGRTRFQNDIKKAIQASADNYSLGVRVTSVQIKRLEPPKSIKKAFDGVSTARSEKQKLIQESRGERSALLTKARSEASDMKLDAKAYATEVLERAKGDHQRFSVLLEAYETSPQITKTNQYLDELEKILSKSKITVVKAK